MNHYETLGVDQSATQDDIQEAYRAKARKLHPDAGGSKEEFQTLLEAYEVLSDEGKRGRYDRGESIETNEHAIEAIVRSMAVAAFEQDRQNPLRYMRDHVDKVRAENQDNKREKTRDLEKLKGKLATFIQLNEGVKNPQARDLIVELLTGQVEYGESLIKSLEKQIQLGTDTLAFLDGLQFPDEKVKSYSYEDRHLGATMEELRDRWPMLMK
jgi:curved DNA-binding protein CbpA